MTATGTRCPFADFEDDIIAAIILLHIWAERKDRDVVAVANPKVTVKDIGVSPGIDFWE
ncbi:MAG: hypothetical protein V1778_01540 [bacterium]